MEPTTEWLTIGEAAELLEMVGSEQTVRRMADDGQLGVVRWTRGPGRGQRRVTAAGVEAFRQLRDGAASPSTED